MISYILLGVSMERSGWRDEIAACIDPVMKKYTNEPILELNEPNEEHPNAHSKIVAYFP